jgi:hypothetical protein
MTVSEDLEALRAKVGGLSAKVDQHERLLALSTGLHQATATALEWVRKLVMTPAHPSPATGGGAGVPAEPELNLGPHGVGVAPASGKNDPGAGVSVCGDDLSAPRAS